MSYNETFHLTSEEQRVLLAVSSGALLEQGLGGYWYLNGERLPYRSTGDRFSLKVRPRLMTRSYEEWEQVEPEDEKDTGSRWIGRTNPKLVLTEAGEMAAHQLQGILR